MSLLFQAMRKTVHYHDAFAFNADVGATILAEKPAMSRIDVEDFLRNVSPTRSHISEVFDGVFYPAKENMWLDGYMQLLMGLDKQSAEAQLLRYLVYQACLRKRPFNLFHRANLSLRTKEKVERSFGNLTTWNRSFDDHIIEVFDVLTKNCGYVRGDTKVLPSGDVLSVEPGYDLVYLDPPYVSLSEKNNRDGYWRRYHFLEGLANYGDWRDLVDEKSPIKAMPEPAHFLQWSRKSTFQEKLFQLMERHSRSIVVLSYVTDAYPSEDEIRQHFERIFRKVTVHSAPYSHALSKGKKRELLFVGQP